MLNAPATTQKQTVAAGVTTRLGCSPTSTTHQIKIGAGTATSGTVTLTALSAGDSTGEAVYYNGSAIVFDAAVSASQTFVIDGGFDAFVLTPTALNGTYTYIYSEW